MVRDFTLVHGGKTHPGDMAVEQAAGLEDLLHRIVFRDIPHLRRSSMRIEITDLLRIDACFFQGSFHTGCRSGSAGIRGYGIKRVCVIGTSQQYSQRRMGMTCQ